MKTTIYSTAVNRELTATQHQRINKAIAKRKKDRKSTFIGLLMLGGAIGLVLILNSFGLIHNI